MGAYFNTDWLEEDRLDISEGAELNELGQPIDTPDLSGLMMDYLVEGEGVLNLGETDQGTGDPFHYSVWSGTYDDDGNKTYQTYTGAETWERSGAPGLLAGMDPYDQWSEKNRKKSTVADISQSLNKIEQIQSASKQRTNQIQSIAGRSGFESSGKMNKMQAAHYGDTSRTIQGATSNIKKSVLGYASDVDSLRTQHIDDMWSLYSDWLSLDPEISTSASPITANDEEAIEIIEDNYTIDDEGIVEEEVSFENEGWANAAACQYAGGTMQPNPSGPAWCDATGDAWNNYEEYIDNINNCDVATWVANNGTCGPPEGTEPTDDDPYGTSWWEECECGADMVANECLPC